jgi:biotin carboxylase
MTAHPMHRGQNAAALIATLLAAAALLPLEPRVRFVMVGLAAASIAVLLVVRLRGHAVRRDDARSAATYARIERIREARAKRDR